MKQHPIVVLPVTLLLRTQLRNLHTHRIGEACARTETVTSIATRIQRLRRLIGVSRYRMWDGATRRLVEQMRRAVDELSIEAHGLPRAFDHLHVQLLPSAQQVAEELDQILDEFHDFEFNPKAGTLSVKTEPIELEGVYLGPFEIVLHLQQISQMSRATVYEVEALDPHPAAGGDHVTHPHVSDNHLCEGDAMLPIRSALQSGRLADFFLLVRSVLTTYNPDSPYVSLDNWEGEACADCGAAVSDDYRTTCERCESVVCDDCTSICESCCCGHCGQCITTCPLCDETSCLDCMSRCARCQRPCCRRCLENTICTECRESEEPDDDTTEESTGSAAQSRSAVPAAEPSPAA